MAPYWGIPTADTTTPLSDDNASDPTRKRPKDTSTLAPETEGATPATTARQPAKKSAAAARTANPGAPKSAAARPAQKPDASLPPTPVWAPEQTVMPKLAVLAEPTAEVVPPPIPDWDRASPSTSWPDARRENAGSTTRPPPPVSSAGAHHQQHPRTRAFTTTVVLASLFVVFVAVTLTLVLLLHSDNPPPRTASTAAVNSPEAARLQTATKVMGGDTSAALAGLHALTGIPTTVTVAAVMNPYVSTLQHYQTVLAGARVPTSARAAAASVRALLSGDVQSLATIDGLPPLRLGAYLEGFSADATQLQKDLGTLERALRGPTR